MCGIVGFLGARGLENAEGVISAMARTLAHRGPDDQHFWRDEAAGLAFGFRRLAILDLSINGRQPMHSRSGRYTLLYNGEIYNHRELRARLSGPWRGHSDTESMLAAIEAWGVRPTLEALDGMFGLAVWDRETRCLTLARDRFGEKPLYYGWPDVGTVRRPLLFGSELKALAAFPGWRWSIDQQALAQYLRFGYVPAPLSITVGIRKLRPGHFVEIPFDAAPGDPAPEAYWDMEGVFNDAHARSRAEEARDEDALLDELDALLTRTVASRLESDVPLGAFLSGGIDSSLIVALMRRRGAVRTFTIGFADSKFDESPHAEAVAAHLGTDHRTAIISEADVREMIPRLPTIYDEPFSDVSQMPTTLLSMITKREVTVALSGDGGDELFGGYPRYKSVADGWRRIANLPAGFRAMAGGMADLVPRNAMNTGLGGLGRLRGRRSRPGDRLYRRLSEVGAEGIGSYARQRVQKWPNPLDLVALLEPERTDSYRDGNGLPPETDPMAAAMYLDSRAYLPDDLLTKVDRASMSVGLEVRAPLLAPEVAAFAWSLPAEFVWRQGQGKWMLRELLARYVPSDLIDRPKQGFEPPVGSWLRGNLRDWAESLLEAGHLRDIGIANPKPVRDRWHEHLSGERDWRFHLWTVLMYAAWNAHWRESGEVPGAAATYPTASDAA